ncbi:MAG: DUF1272 domain-containing protein [Phycicoccus sp.]|nr:DUF1272 domain-containing protein [Phycicoccus sp.]
MLELRPSCECCDADLPASSPDVVICTFECTWCRECAGTCISGTCPNCGGDLQQRLIRPVEHLTDHPASTHRIHQPGLHRPGMAVADGPW